MAAGFSGNKKSLYQCVKCGFFHEYDGIADKDTHKIFSGGYKNKGLNAVYIDTIRKVTPDCVFCGKPQDLYIKQDGGGYRFVCGQCNAEFRCEFTFGGKIKGKSTQILDCGEINISNLQVGSCDADILIKDNTKIKYKRTQVGVFDLRSEWCTVRNYFAYAPCVCLAAGGRIRRDSK